MYRAYADSEGPDQPAYDQLPWYRTKNINRQLYEENDLDL